MLARAQAVSDTLIAVTELCCPTPCSPLPLPAMIQLSVTVNLTMADELSHTTLLYSQTALLAHPTPQGTPPAPYARPH